MSDLVIESKDPNQHEHICPDCRKTWACTDHWPTWDQEDTDCRWHTEVVCKDCLKKRVLNVDFSEAELKIAALHGIDVKDPHVLAGMRIYGKDVVMTPEMRREVKAAQYASMYDASPDLIEELLGPTGRIPHKDIP